MGSHQGGATAAAAVVPQYGPPLLALPQMDRPPALLTMPELEAVTAALPGKKRRLRETFERLAASSPDPLPFTWEDLDKYLSSFQYSTTLRLRQVQESQSQVPILATTEDGVVEKAKKRKASSEAAEASEGAHEGMRGVVEKDEAEANKKACPLKDVDGNGTRLLCAAPLGGASGFAEACGSTDTRMPLDHVAKIAVVRPEDPAPRRRASNTASLVPDAPNQVSQQCRPLHPAPAPAPAVPTLAISGGDAENANKLGVGRTFEKMFVSHKPAREAKVSPSLPANDAGNMSAGAKADLQMDRPLCKIKIKAADHEVPTTTRSPSRAGIHITPALTLDSTSRLVSLAPKQEDSDVNVHVVVAEETVIHEVTEADKLADNASPLKVNGRYAHEVSPLSPLSSGDGFEVAGADVGTIMLAEAGRNSVDPAHLPDNSLDMPLKVGANAKHVLQQQHMSQVRSKPISRGQKQSSLFSRNHAGRPTTGFNVVCKAHAVQRLTKEPPLGKGGPGQDNRPAATRPSSLPDGKGKPMVIESSGDSKNSNIFCYKCGSKGHVAHKCRTAKHLVELYLKHKKEKQANRVCFRCGTRGHMASKCRTPKHLVDLYQNHRAAERKASFRAKSS